jgi:hypothetical protein
VGLGVGFGVGFGVGGGVGLGVGFGVGLGVGLGVGAMQLPWHSAAVWKGDTLAGFLSGTHFQSVAYAPHYNQPKKSRKTIVVSLFDL